MILSINGENMEFESGKNIDEILAILGVEAKIFAITLNAKLVKRESYSETFPQDGDKIEMLQFMGGG